jgi:hypothetical protein
MVKKKGKDIFNSYQHKKAPTYEDLNAFMGPSMLSPKYENPDLNFGISPESPKSRKLSTSDSHASDSDNDSVGECNVSYKTDGTYATNASSKDLKLYEMKCMLDKKRKAMYDKNGEVKKLSSDNPYLSSVLSDYGNLRGTILEEKKSQKTALKILSKHIREISEHIKDDEFQLERIRDDMSILMDEIDKLREDISYIRDKMDEDSPLSYIKQDKHPQNKRRHDRDNSDDTDDTDDSSSEFNENSSEEEDLYDERY